MISSGALARNLAPLTCKKYFNLNSRAVTDISSAQISRCGTITKLHESDSVACVTRQGSQRHEGST